MEEYLNSLTHKDLHMIRLNYKIKKCSLLKKDDLIPILITNFKVLNIIKEQVELEFNKIIEKAKKSKPDKNDIDSYLNKLSQKELRGNLKLLGYKESVSNLNKQELKDNIYSLTNIKNKKININDYEKKINDLDRTTNIILMTDIEVLVKKAINYEHITFEQVEELYNELLIKNKIKDKMN